MILVTLSSPDHVLFNWSIRLGKLNIDLVFCVDIEVKKGFQNLDCNVTDMVDCQVAYFIV